MQRACPRDAATLAERRLDGVNLDECPTCHGVFFDAVELRRVPGIERLALDLAAAQNGEAQPAVACPACSARMHVDTRGGIAVDHCSGCLGIWLDAGELAKLSRRSRPVPPAAAPAQSIEADRAAVARALQTLTTKLEGMR